MRALWAVLAGATVLASGSACAMSADGSKSAACSVVGGEKLPANSGGADAICKAIADAAAERAPGVAYDVQVTVTGNSRLKASITTADGQKLPDQNFVRSDRPLTKESFERFANTIAENLAKAGTGESSSL